VAALARADLGLKQIIVPGALLGPLVVGEHIGAPLRLAPAPGNNDRHLFDLQLLRGQDPAVPRDRSTVLVNENLDRPAPLFDRAGDLTDLLFRVSQGIRFDRDSSSEMVIGLDHASAHKLGRGLRQMARNAGARPKVLVPNKEIIRWRQR
jgi:hypothetical protein